MTPGTRRLPEDSVVASLSEIQAIIHTGEQERTRVAAPAPQAPARRAPSTGQGPVPTAAELRATREARWQEEMVQPARAVNGARRPMRTVALVVASLLLVGVGGAGLIAWQRPAPQVVEAPIEAPVPAVVAVAPAVPVPPAISPEVSESAENAPGAVVAKARPSRRPNKAASGRRGDGLDSMFGPRATQSRDRGRMVSRPVVKRKRTKADSQLDSVLNGL